MAEDAWGDAELVEELCEIESGLSEWEVDFVESLAKWMQANESLTDRQRDKALDILEERS